MPVDIDAGLTRLDEIAREEYGTDFATAITTSDELLTIRRMARLAGIELKYPFATAEPIAEGSQTGACQQWLFKNELIIPDVSGALPLDQLKGNPSYELELRIYDELQRQGDPGIAGVPFALFL